MLLYMLLYKVIYKFLYIIYNIYLYNMGWVFINYSSLLDLDEHCCIFKK